MKIVWAGEMDKNKRIVTQLFFFLKKSLQALFVAPLLLKTEEDNLKYYSHLVFSEYNQSILLR